MSTARKKAEMGLRQWTQKSLRPADYAFAISNARGRWESPSHNWHRRLVFECLAWEIEREYCWSKKKPFIVAQKKRIEEVQQYRKSNPHDWPALNEVLDLDGALSAIREQPNFPLSTFHLFEIEHQEGTEITAQRFRNWLVGKATSRVSKCYDKSGRTVNRTEQKGRRFICANGAVAFSHHRPSGRRDVLRALLRAIAVRRLKLAGYTRRNAAEKVLQMNDPLLGRDQWKDLPKKAEAEILKSKRHRGMEKSGGLLNSSYL